MLYYKLWKYHPLPFFQVFHVGALSSEQTLTQSMGSSLSPACFISAVDYSVLFFPKLLPGSFSHLLSVG